MLHLMKESFHFFPPDRKTTMCNLDILMRSNRGIIYLCIYVPTKSLPPVSRLCSASYKPMLAITYKSFA